MEFYRKTMIHALYELVISVSRNFARFHEPSLHRTTSVTQRQGLGWLANCDTRRVFGLSKGDRNAIGEKRCSGSRWVCRRLRLARRLQSVKEKRLCCHDRSE